MPAATTLLPLDDDVPPQPPRSVTASPAFVPAYDPAIPDATVRCDGGPVRVTATVRFGETTERHVVRCLPADFPLWATQRSGTADVGWIAMTPTVNAPPVLTLTMPAPVSPTARCRCPATSSTAPRCARGWTRSTRGRRAADRLAAWPTVGRSVELDRTSGAD